MAKFFLWKEPGQIELKKFFATLGIPLDQAKQKYTYMDAQYRNELKQKIMDVS